MYIEKKSHYDPLSNVPFWITVDRYSYYNEFSLKLLKYQDFQYIITITFLVVTLYITYRGDIMWDLKFIVKSKSRRKKILKLIKEMELTDENIQLIVDIIIECDNISQNLLRKRFYLYFERFDETYDGRNYTYSSKDYVRIMNGLESLELHSFKFSEKILAYLESKLPEDKSLQILNYVNEMHSKIHENNDFNEEQKFVELGDKKIEYYRRMLSFSKKEKEEEKLLEQSGLVKKLTPSKHK